MSGSLYYDILENNPYNEDCVVLGTWIVERQKANYTNTREDIGGGN